MDYIKPLYTILLPWEVPNHHILEILTFTHLFYGKGVHTFRVTTLFDRSGDLHQKKPKLKRQKLLVLENIANI